MNEDKINEVGKKLDVELSDIKRGKQPNFKKLPLYILYQFVIFIVTSVWSNFLGYSKKYDTYPFFSYIYVGIPGAALVLSLHTANGYFSFTKEERFKLSKRPRSVFFLINIFLSLIVFIQLFVLVQRPEYMSGVMYGVFEASGSNR